MRSIGLSSGASVPEGLVREVLAELEDAGYRDIHEVRTAEGRECSAAELAPRPGTQWWGDAEVFK